jgi:hypothetical protein
LIEWLFGGHPPKQWGATNKAMMSITGHLIYRAFIVMDIVDEDLIDFIHHCINRLGTKFLGQGRKTFHVTEHHLYLALFSLDSVSLGKDLLGNHTDDKTFCRQDYQSGIVDISS